MIVERIESMSDKENKSKGKERYDFSTRESYWQNFWEREKIYAFDPNSEKPLYTIDTPPPTISGSLHLGHIYSYIQAEVVARYKRMVGFNVRYPFGYDDNGLPTERLVEKELGIKAQDQSIEDFRRECLKIVKRYSAEFKELWQSIGLSVDWRLEYSTISDEVQRLSQKTFIDLCNRGAIYRQEAPALYCYECGTSIAKAEVEDKEFPSVFYNLFFITDSDEKITVSTTRPELLPACVAVFVNPQDKRYSRLVGGSVTTPLGDKVRIIADDLVSVEKGSGVVMCSTFGDERDLYWFRKYGLPSKVIISDKGRILKVDSSPFLEGLTITEAREKIVDELKKRGHIESEQQISHSVGVHERCSTPVEIIHRTQWFARILDKKKELIEFGHRIKWYPDYMEHRYRDWVENLNWDWCISRERFFGVPVPAYVCDDCSGVVFPKAEDLPLDPKEEQVVHFCSHCGSESLKPEAAVLDTWFTSALTPDINNNHPLNGKLREKILPLSMRPQAHDIIRTWTVYSVLMCILSHNNIPWEHIMISGHILDKGGEKISKKTGGGKYRPEELIRQHSADALRYAMCQANLGRDSYYDEAQVKEGKRLVTKLYNSGKFVLTNLVDFRPDQEIHENQLVATDRWIMQQANRTLESMRRELDGYEFANALRRFERFFWNDFSDNYLELIKGRIYSEDKSSRERRSAQLALYNVYLRILQMAAPFLPHITEEMYHSEPISNGKGRLKSECDGGYFYHQTRIASIHNTEWEEIPGIVENEEIARGAQLMLKVLSGVRKHKSEHNMRLGDPLNRLVIVCGDKTQEALISGFIPDLKYASRSEEIIVITEKNEDDYQADLILRL